jgi:hypothetical protein
MRQRRALVIVLGVVLLASRVGPTTILAAAPDLPDVTPAEIAIDAADGDWDDPAADFLSDMFGRANRKDVLSRLYGRYDCSTETFYVSSRPSRLEHPAVNSDNYVKLGQTDKLVDSSSGHNGAPPDFIHRRKAWEAAFHLAPGSLPRRQRPQRSRPSGPRAVPRHRRWRTASTSPLTAAHRPAPAPAPTDADPTPTPTANPPQRPRRPHQRPRRHRRRRLRRRPRLPRDAAPTPRHANAVPRPRRPHAPPAPLHPRPPRHPPHGDLPTPAPTPTATRRPHPRPRPRRRRSQWIPDHRPEGE